MATETFINYPASGVYSGITNIMNALATFIIEKFPIGTIKALHVDDRVSIQNLYKNVLSSYKKETTVKFDNIEEITKIPRPHCYVGWSLENGFDTETTGLNTFPLYHYPHAYFFDDEMVGVNPIFHDTERNIFIGCQYLRIKLSAEFLFNCINKEEQITLYTYMKNNIKDLYMYAVPNIAVNYIMPSYLLMMLKNILFGENTPYTAIHEIFNTYLKKYSNEGIIPVYRKDNKDVFYEMLVDYRQIDFQLTGRMQIDDGEKKDQVYSNYTIRFPAQAECYIPHNYILKTPELIPNTFCGVYQMPDHIPLSYETDSNNHIQVLNVIKKKVPFKSRIYFPEYTLIASDEFAIETSDDFYETERLFKKTFKAFYNLLSQEERKRIFKIVLYEGSSLVDDSQIKVDWDTFTIFFKDCDIRKVFTIEVYINLEIMRIELSKKITQPSTIFTIFKLIAQKELSLSSFLVYTGYEKMVHNKEFIAMFKQSIDPTAKLRLSTRNNTGDTVDSIFEIFLEKTFDTLVLEKIYTQLKIPYDKAYTREEAFEKLFNDDTIEVPSLMETIIRVVAKKSESIESEKILSMGISEIETIIKKTTQIYDKTLKLTDLIRTFTVRLFNDSKIIKEL